MMRDFKPRTLALVSIAISGAAFVASPAWNWADDTARASATDQPKKESGEPKTGPASDGAQKSGGADKGADKKVPKAERKKAPVLVGVIAIAPIPSTDPAVPSGGALDANVPDAWAMRDTLAELTEAAFTREGLDDLVERLVDQDRNRIGEFVARRYETLDGRIAQLQEAWKGKYGEEFDIRQAQVYAPLAFAQGRITDASAFVNKWPVDPTPSKPGDRPAQPAGAGVVTDRVRDEANIENGRTFGIARLPAEFGLPALHVSFIDEAYGWKVDAPNALSGPRLYENLLSHLTYLGENVHKWPSDVNDAYRCATHHVLMAIYGLDVPRAADAGPDQKKG